MQKGYIWKRLLRSLISILIIMVIVFTMIYTMVPRENIFFEDSTYRKLSSKSDDKTEYVYSTWQKLGYLDYVRINDYCLTLYEAGSPEMNAAVQPDSPESRDFADLYASRGYTVETYLGSGRYARLPAALPSSAAAARTSICCIPTAGSPGCIRTSSG